MSAFVISVVVALVELPISETGIIGCIMNLVSSAAFACTAAYFYSRKRTLEGAALSLEMCIRDRHPRNRLCALGARLLF